MAWQQPYGTGQYGQPPPQLYAQPTGFAPGGLQPPQLRVQPTGYPGQQPGYGAPPMPSMPAQYAQQQQRGGYGGQPSMPPTPSTFGQPQRLVGQATGYPTQQPSPQPQYPQPTGFGGGGGYQQPSYQQQPPPQPQYAQPTGYGANFGGMGGGGGGMMQPAGQMGVFQSVFMPANPTAPTYGAGHMQFQHPSQLHGQSLQQNFQQQNVQQHGQAVVKVPWALSAEEQKNYDQIFRAWDQRGTGFISGTMAQEVFGQSGLDRDDLMKIWNLADSENRGKLNLAEFHVAMGLIYRCINGNTIPDQLPPELVPPSARDLDKSVDFLKDLLRNDTNQRATASPTQFPDISGGGGGRDSPSYAKSRSLHGGPEPRSARKDASGYKYDDSEETKSYKPSSRHVDRRAVRYSGEDSPRSDLDEMRRQLDNTQSMLDRDRQREDEDDKLAEEREDLMYQIRRVQRDIEHNSSSGRRTEQRDAERRRLDRELDSLRYERLPELERKIEDRERDKAQRKRAAARERDQRNDRSAASRHDDRRGRSEDDYDSSRRRDTTPPPRDRRDRSPAPEPPTPKPAPPAPPVPPAPAPQVAPTPAPAPTPSPQPGAKSMATMTPDERKEFIRQEAARRVQERLRVFGVAPSGAGATTTPAVDTSVSQRLEDDKKEAARRAAEADREADEREKQRQLRLEREKVKDVKADQAETQRQADALRTVEREVTQQALGGGSTGGAGEALEGARAELEREEKAIQERADQLQRERAQREERMRKLEQELADERQAEEDFKRKKDMFAAKSSSKGTAPPPPAPRSSRVPPPAPASRGVARAPAVWSDAPKPAAAAPPAPTPPRAPSPPPAPPPPAPPAPAAPPAPSMARDASSGSAPSTNPFHRMGGGAAPGPSAPLAPPAPNNPFFRTTSPAAAAAAPPAPTAPFKPPVRAAVATDDDWDTPSGAKDSDDSDDEGGATKSRNARAGLASALFGGSTSTSISRPSTPAAPSAPAAPAFKPPSGPPAARGDLLSAIQGGARLRKATTNDRSTAGVAGRVIGDPSPPVQTYVPPPSPPRAPSPPPAPRAPPSHRESVDWIGGLANDVAVHSPTLPAHVEEADEEPAAASSGLENVDMSVSTRSRALYAYADSSRPDDLAFDEGAIITTHPAKDTADWLYGTLATSGQKGWLPAAYVQSIENGRSVKALYDYAGASADEATLQADERYTVVDEADPDWAKVEQHGRIVLAPAAYLDLAGSSGP